MLWASLAAMMASMCVLLAVLMPYDPEPYAIAAILFLAAIWAELVERRP